MRPTCGTFGPRQPRRFWKVVAGRCLAVNPAFPVQAILWEFRPNDVVSHRMYKGHRRHSTVRLASQTVSIH
ncbi:MAG: hypothetical protein E7Z96_07910 [Actinomycetaceae bacterium]|nr:hypothetical protein [Actinomycetaceae bacterium]